MKDKSNKRDIRKEIDDLKRKASEAFRSRGIPEPGRGFLERASRFDPSSAVDEPPPDGGQVSRSDEDIIMGELRDIIRKTRDREEPASGGREVFVDLESAVSGEETAFGSGAFYRITESCRELDRENGENYLEILSDSALFHDQGDPSLELLSRIEPDRVCYLDIETTGLKSSPLFLIGLLYKEGDGLVVDQLFARDYGEEKSLLEFTSDYLRRFSLVVTFNGKSFDIPYILERMALWGIGGFGFESHLDLLHLSRKVVGGNTPNHRLQTLERCLLGSSRIDDTPGHRIPDLYHDFVRSGNAAAISGIIEHNRIDLVSMARLVMLFLSGPLP